MCTVLFDVSPGEARPFALLGTRDEFADRPWDLPGAWWPEHPELIGGRDREAGGTWLAVHPSGNRMSVVLNRWERAAEPAGGWFSRGILPLLAAGSEDIPEELVRRMRPFNLLTASAVGAHWLAWDGSTVTRTAVQPGVHMLGAGDLDGSADQRVDVWLPRLDRITRPDPAAKRAGDRDRGPWEPWMDLLRESANQLPADASAALIRRVTVAGRLHGTLALCGVVLTGNGPRFDFAGLPEPGVLPEHISWTRAH